jgi:hypothetical protein
MILSRFWYLLLAAAACAAATGALLAQATFNREHTTNLNNQLRRDRTELELWLRLDARSRIDAIAPIAAHPEVRDALRKASRDDEVDSDRSEALAEQLKELNGQLEEMQGDLVFAVDRDGTIISQLGGKDAPEGAGLGAFPLVERALSGYVRDDVWVYNDEVYRMAARPVIDGGNYVGAIVHGMGVDSELAERLAERLPGASVAFFKGQSVIAGHMPSVEGAARSSNMESRLPEVMNKGTLDEEGHTKPMDVGSTARGVYGLTSGSAAHAGVGYAIARPHHALSSPLAIFEEAASEDVASLPWVTLAGAAIALFLLGMLWMWLERDRPFKRLRNAIAALASRQTDRLPITDFGGGYRKVAEGINEALDRVAESSASAAPKRKAADLDEILGPTPGNAGGPSSYFGFASDESQGEVPAAPPGSGGPQGGGSAEQSAAARNVSSGQGPAQPPAPQQPAAAGGQPAPQPAQPSAPQQPAAAGGQPAAPAAGPAAGKAPPPPPPAGKAKAPPPPPPKGGQAPAASSAAAGTAATGGESNAAPGSNGGAAPSAAASPQTPAQPATPAPSGSGAGRYPPVEEEDDDDDEEGATMVASVPEELLSASAEEGESAEDEEQRHFKEVFEQFKATKEQCGESTANLTFDKFSQTLRKNRDQIVQRHGAKKVRFTVYVKSGKAALKATPVRE